jgi:hypothetical protein
MRVRIYAPVPSAQQALWQAEPDFSPAFMGYSTGCCPDIDRESLRNLALIDLLILTLSGKKTIQS